MPKLPFDDGSWEPAISGSSSRSAVAMGDSLRSTADRFQTARTRWRTWADWWVSRPALAAAVIYAGLSLLMVAQGLLPGRTLSSSDFLWSAVPWTRLTPLGVRGLGSNFDLTDAAVQSQLFLQYSRSVFPHVALWNPYIGSGRPFLADALSAVFSPFSLPAYVLPFWHSLAVIAALKLFVAAFGTYFFGRALRMRFGGALLAGVVFAFGLFIVSWLSWPHTNVWVLLPWLLLLTEHLVRRPGPLSLAGFSGVVALQYLGGQPESSFHVLFATVAFFGFRVSQRPLAGQRITGATAVLAVGVVAGTALAAIAVVPFLELLSHSDLTAQRAALAGAAVDRPGFRTGLLPYVLSLFLPDYWGRATQTPLTFFHEEFAYYAGALTLLLAVGALVLRRSSERIAVAVFGVFSLAVAVRLPPIYGIVTRLPGFHMSKNSRMAVLFVLAVALLAGWGLDDLSGRRPTARRQQMLLGLGATLLLVPVVWVEFRGELSLEHLGRALDVAWGFAKPGGSVPAAHTSPARTIRLAALLGWLVLGGSGLALIALRLWQRLTSQAFVVLAVCLIVTDLFRAGVGLNPAVPISHASQPVTGAIRYLQSRRPNRFVGLASSGFVDPLPPNVAMRYGLYDARAYDYPVERRYGRVWSKSLISTPDGPPIRAPATPAALRVLRLLSVADLLEGPHGSPLRLPGLRLAYSGADASVYADSQALPRVFVVDQQRVVAGDARAMAAVTAPTFDGRRLALTEHRVPYVPQSGPDVTSGGSAHLISYAAARVVATATTGRPGLLVLTDNFFPGWRASVDGRPTPIYRVDYLLRGVPLSAGTHRVVFSYQPTSWRWARIISGLALLALVATVWVGWRRRRAARVPADRKRRVDRAA